MKVILLLLAGIVLLACVVLTALSIAGRRPHVGLVNGRLRPCPNKPNCFCSEEKGTAAAIDPLAFHGLPSHAWEQLKKAIQEMGGKIQRQSDEYIWATFTTRVFRFVDDMEFRMVAGEGTIHIRSASRVGYSDLGVNKRRVEELRLRFDEGVNAQGAGLPTGPGPKSWRDSGSGRI